MFFVVVVGGGVFWVSGFWVGFFVVLRRNYLRYLYLLKQMQFISKICFPSPNYLSVA